MLTKVQEVLKLVHIPYTSTRYIQGEKLFQVRKIYEFIPNGQTNPIKNDKPLDPDIVFPDVPTLVSSLSNALEQVPEKDRVNLFCTLWHQDVDKDKRKKKTWGRQELLLFDIDLGDGNARDVEKDVEYLKALSQAIKVPEEKILQIFSGHGYHFALQLASPITDKTYFNKNKVYYQVLCSRINDVLRDMGLPGEADTEVFAPNRLLRFPGSLNKKKNKPEVWVQLIKPSIGPVDFSVRAASGMPEVNEEDYLSEKELSYIKTDDATVESGCEFLKHAKANQAEMSEGEWYAVLSIVGRLKDGMEKAHEYSKFHPSYSPKETETKTEQALKASGPRTCDNIDKLWGRCKTCKFYKKVTSPITIKGKDFIATAHSGFHMLARNGRLVPQYDDLRKFYDQDTPYKNVARVHYRYEENHWQELDDVFIDNYAEQKFSPPAKNTMRSEFRGKVKCTNLERPEWFQKTTHRKINLLNGVLDIDKMELSPHDPAYGFRSVLPFEYDPKAECPTFEKMLDGVTLGRETLKRVLLEYMGYCLSNDDPRADKILVLTGEGQNGKSRFLNIWRAIGGDGVTALNVRDLQNSFHLQQLDGALFNIIEEVPAFSDKDVWELIKGLVTGASVTASRKFKDPYTFENKAKFVMTCNELPKGANPNHGYFRRLLIVPFEAVFSHELGNIDVGIDRRVIETELSGVLNLVLGAYHRLRENEYQFSDSREVKAALDEYKTDMDSVSRFVDDCIVIGAPGADIGGAPQWFIKDSDGKVCIDLEELYVGYAERCKKLGDKQVAFRTFTKRVYLSLHSTEVVGTGQVPDDKPYHHRVRINGERKRVIYNVSWHNAAEF